MLILRSYRADLRDRTVRADVEWAPHVGQGRPSRCRGRLARPACLHQPA